LANLEYRIPILGPTSLALFADVGTAFNLRKGNIQTINTNFLRDQPFLFPSSINSLVAQKYPQYASSFFTGALLLLNGEGPLLRSQLRHLPGECLLIPSNCGIEEIHLRGEAQTNTLIRLSDSSFAKFGDFRSSVGAEFRVQVPVINVPFRLIYFFNPNARTLVTVNGQQLNFGEKRNGWRFSVGRTF
jgi:outer membrane protein insertion porin family